MRAFVTGASGFIGYHVARVLKADGHHVRALVRSPLAAQRLQDLGVEVVMGDLVTGDGVDQAMLGCEAVFHVAAHYSLNRQDKDLMYVVNVKGTERVLAAARKQGIRRVVYTSSTATIGLTNNAIPADESRFVEPDEVKSDYKRTKVLAERIVLEACHKGMDIVIVNPSTPVGCGDVKPTPTGKIVLDTLMGRMPGYVRTGLNIVSVEDVAIGHLLAYYRGQQGDRYILGNENIEFGDLLARIASVAGRSAPRLRIPFWVAWSAAMVDEFVISPLKKTPPHVPLAGVQLAKRPMYFTAEKAIRELQLPQTPIDLALRQSVKWFQDEYREASLEKG